MTSLRTLQLFWHTVRYLRFQQIVDRLRLRAAAAWSRHWPLHAQGWYARKASRAGLLSPDSRWVADGARARAVHAGDFEATAARAADAEVGRFSFLSVESSFGRPIDWLAPEQSQLWRYKLQYGGYLVDLAAIRPDGWPAVASLMREWIAANPLGESPDAWHPFVVSERIVNWMVAVRICVKDPNGIGEDILRSLAAQCGFVDANLETDVGGNHLLKNLKAMTIAGCFWAGDAAEEWYTRYMAAFARELNEQLLADGAHYERSPMYHALVLQDALELAAVARASRRPLPEDFVGSIRAMVDYLTSVTHPDGELALFNDSVFGEAPTPAALHQFASRVLDDAGNEGGLTVRQAVMSSDLSGPAAALTPAWRPASLEDSGLVQISRRPYARLFVDVGRACPDDLPAHAHADLFSFELSLGEERFIADSGVGEYRAGAWREYYRSTRAHNTLAVDGEDQIECWGSFRVARRAQIRDRRLIDTGLAHGVTARHDGYERLRRPVSVRRTVLELADCGWLVVDRLDGRGHHNWESYVHGAPDVEMELLGGRHGRLWTGRRDLGIAWFGFTEASVVRGAPEPVQGWYAPEFGRHIPVPVLVLRGSGEMPVECGYILVPGATAKSISVERQAGGLELVIGASRFVATLDDGRVDIQRHVS